MLHHFSADLFELNARACSYPLDCGGADKDRLIYQIFLVSFELDIPILTYVLPAIYSPARSAQVNYFTALLLYTSGLGSAFGSPGPPASHSASLSLADSSERSISDSLDASIS
mgnify:CR=1 FL=1